MGKEVKRVSLGEFNLVDTTLREGEQSAKVFYSKQDRLEIVRLLDYFGVEYIELPSPVISKQMLGLIKEISALSLKAKVITHVRCKIEDAKLALSTGVDGINLFLGTSDLLKKYSHGKSSEEILATALEVVAFIKDKSPETEVRFSAEDTFRSDKKELFKLYRLLDKRTRLDRFGLADTVGTVLPKNVENVIKSIRQFSNKDIEFHTHNDTGCAIINSYTALKAGATHINTSLLGLGERNGITPLAGLLTILYCHKQEMISNKYRLKFLKELISEFAKIVGVQIPYNHYLIGETAFSHKAGVHSNAVLKDARSYEGIKAEDFAIKREIILAHNLLGYNALEKRAKDLGLKIAKQKLRVLTKEIKEIAFDKKISQEKIDKMLIDYSKEL